MHVETQIASQEYLSTRGNLKDINYKWFELKGTFEIGSVAPQKIRVFLTLL